MRAVNGYLEDGRFTPAEVISLPRRIPVMLVFNEADLDSSKLKQDSVNTQSQVDIERRAAWLSRLHKAVDASLDEYFPDIPPRQPMRPPLDFTD